MASADDPAPVPAGSIEARLPPELLSHIFSHLDAPAPSDLALRELPKSTMFEAPAAATPLKHASLVCRRWRDVVLPLLFRHALWHLDRWELLLVEPKADHVAAVPLLAHLRAADLGRYVLSWTMVVGDSYGGQYSLRMRDGAWSSVHTGSLSGLGPERSARATPVLPGAEGGFLPDTATYGENNNWLWDAIFSVVDPLRFTIVASPRMLTSLMSRMLFLGDSWGFQVPYHILSLSRKESTRRIQPPREPGKTPESNPPVYVDHWPEPAAEPSSSSSKCTCPENTKTRVPCNLFTMRPWTAALLNEGSSTKIYRTYEFFLKRPPSILGALLGAEDFPNDEPLLPPTVRDFSYIAVFPLSSHFNTLVHHLPPLRRLFVQLVPSAESGVLDDPAEMRGLDPSDLWMERNTCYSLVMHEMLDPGSTVTSGPPGAWDRLREFESGDAADREAWAMAAEYVRLAGSGWRVGGEGVFLRRADGDEDDEEEEGIDFSDGDEDGPPYDYDDLHYADDDSITSDEDEEAGGGDVHPAAPQGGGGGPLLSVQSQQLFSCYLM